jgi:hypothetical protein
MTLDFTDEETEAATGSILGVRMPKAIRAKSDRNRSASLYRHHGAICPRRGRVLRRERVGG